ncbi:hypothetical protein TNCV_2665541 [Trichonephila clavipes]|nr:hypothetical protein TNCV_2665541 [Trichonephila clavipes]
MITSVRRLLLAYEDITTTHSTTSEKVDKRKNDVVICCFSQGHQCGQQNSRLSHLQARNLTLDQNDHFSPEAVTGLHRYHRYISLITRHREELALWISDTQLAVRGKHVYSLPFPSDLAIVNCVRALFLKLWDASLLRGVRTLRTGRELI